MGGGGVALKLALLKNDPFRTAVTHLVSKNLPFNPQQFP